MKKAVRILVLGVLTPLILFIGLANLLATDTDDIELPTRIEMPDGRRLGVAKALAALEVEASEAPGSAWVPPAEGEAATQDADPMLMALRLHDRGTVVGLGRHLLARGRPKEALALMRAVPEDHPEYSRVQRFIGYEIFAKALQRPDQGVAYVNRSITADPTSGNAWQDAARIYWGAALSPFD